MYMVLTNIPIGYKYKSTNYFFLILRRLVYFITYFIFLNNI